MLDQYFEYMHFILVGNGTFSLFGVKYFEYMYFILVGNGTFSLLGVIQYFKSKSYRFVGSWSWGHILLGILK